MKKALIASLISLFSISAYSDEITLLTDRSDFHVGYIVKAFEESHPNDKVNVIRTKEGALIQRALIDKSIDVVYATEITELEAIQDKLVPLSFSNESVLSEFKSATNLWYSPYYRIRGAVVSKDDNETTTWEQALTKRICIRPLTDAYNISLFTAFDKMGHNLQSLKEQFNEHIVKPASGNDRKQAEMRTAGLCDVGIINSYYWTMMKALPEYKNVIDTSKFVELSTNGNYIAIQSGVGVMKNSKLAQDFAESFKTPSNIEYTRTKIGEYTFDQAHQHIVGAAYTSRANVQRDDLVLPETSASRLDNRNMIYSILSEIK